MFLSTDNTNYDSLFQGDIINDIHILGAINLNSIQYSAVYNQTENYQSWHVLSEPKFGHVMVLSHSCEVSLENDIKVTSIILAPLRDVNQATDPRKIKELIQSNLIDKANPKASYLKYFYIEPHSDLPFTSGSVVDFSKCFSVRRQSYEYLRKNKVLQIKDTTRNSLSLKLALYFHRLEKVA